MGGDGAGVGDVVVGQHIGAGHAQNFKAEDAGHLLEIKEVGVGVLGVPGEVIEYGVVDAVGAFGADVGGGHAGVLEEGRVVGAGAEVADVNLFGGRSVGSAVLVAGVRLIFPLVINRRAQGTGNGAGEFAQEL